MNISELARQVRLSTKELRAIMPTMGYDIGGRAIKVDNKVAQEIIKELGNKNKREQLLQSIKEEVGKEAKDTTTEAESAEEKLAADEIKIPNQVVVKELAKQLQVDVTKLVVELMKQGVMASLNDKIDFETASIVAEDFGFKAKLDLGDGQEATPATDITELIAGTPGSGQPRPPVVVVMGHVDHGKTKLLDVIRQTNVADKESGGITQHIGAYQVEVKLEGSDTPQQLTFIDTPGHEAFSMMRSRGARVADMAILVVAADDGVQPQTIEAISHIKKAGLPFVVAINKIDKPEANPDNVKSGLAEIGVTAEDWSGDIMMVPVSAKQGLHIQDLLESLLLLYDVEKEHITADPAGKVVGTIVESHVNKGSGPIATVLVRNGTLRQGQSVLVGSIPGKIRSMQDWLGHSVTAAGPSMPVAVLGLRSAPQVGEVLQVVDQAEIRKSARLHKKKAAVAAIKNRMISKSDGTKFNLIIKADVLGSLEALQESLSKLNSDDISLNIVSQGLGYITENDIMQAVGSGAYVLGFNTYATPEAEELARTKGIIVKSFEVIYDYLDFVAAEASKKLSPEVTRKELGVFKILKIFREDKDHIIAGGKVIRGEITNDSKVEHYRSKNRLGTGMIAELQSGKEQVSQVVEDQEAGLKLIGLREVQPGDELHCYKEEVTTKKIEL